MVPVFTRINFRKTHHPRENFGSGLIRENISREQRFGHFCVLKTRITGAFTKSRRTETFELNDIGNS